MGYESTSNFNGEQWIMVKYMGYPQFANPSKPTMKEANDRVVYLACNWSVDTELQTRLN